ncbi:MAG: retroviral-like aspartic protease family protein [Steroidobacteraceae bacterium]
MIDALTNVDGSMPRTLLRFGLLLVLTAVAPGAWAQAPLPAAPPTAPPADRAPAPAAAAPGTPGPLYAAPTREDRSGRIHAAVYINGQGPYRFIVDTGANSSALAPGIAEQLALPPAPVMVEVHGVTGTEMLPAVEVQSLRAGDIVLPPAALPVLTGDIFDHADGILGVAGIQQMRMDVDFVRDRVEIAPSAGRRAPPGYLTVPASLWQGGLLLVNGRVGSVPTKVIIDTGAERTIGNLQLRAALIEGSSRGEEAGTTVIGATSDVGEGTYFTVPKIWIGPARLIDLPVTFGDLHVFELWGLTAEPALVVGMDVLGRLERFVVDYRRQEFQMKAKGQHGVGIRRCTPSTCASRIPEKERDF